MPYDGFLSPPSELADRLEYCTIYLLLQDILAQYSGIFKLSYYANVYIKR